MVEVQNSVNIIFTYIFRIFISRILHADITLHFISYNMFKNRDYICK